MDAGLDMDHSYAHIEIYYEHRNMKAFPIRRNWSLSVSKLEVIHALLTLKRPHVLFGSGEALALAPCCINS